MINLIKLRIIVEFVSNNIFAILLIFNNNNISIKQNGIIYITKILVFKNRVPNMKKYYLSTYQKVNITQINLI